MQVIRISAVWCPGCLVIKPIWKEIEKDFPSVEFLDYDYDLDEELIDRYDVGSKLPVAILIDENEKEIRRITGEKTKEEIRSFLGDIK